MSELQTYAHMIERGIGTAFAADKVYCHILRTIQGPHTLTTALRLYQPNKATVAKAEGLGPSVEAHTGVGPIRIYTQAGVVYVEAPSPTGVAVPGEQLRGQGLAVPIGMTSLRTIAGWDAEREPHMLLVGPTGKGKTTAARLLAFHLARQNRAARLRFIVTTFKPKDWSGFRGLAHTLGVITDVDESVQMIGWLTDAMYRRTQEEVDTPHLVVFLDDLLNLLSKAPQVTTQLADIASLGRGAGIHLVIGTQRTGKRGAGDAAVTGNITARLVFSTASAQDAALFTGRGGSGAEMLGRYPGDALLVTEGAGLQRVAVGYMDDGHLAQLPQDDRPIRPWAEGRRETGATGGDSPQNGPVPYVATGATGLPLNTAEELSPAQRALIVQSYQRLGSLTKTCKEIYGRKDGLTFRLIKSALQAEGVEP